VTQLLTLRPVLAVQVQHQQSLERRSLTLAVAAALSSVRRERQVLEVPVVAAQEARLVLVVHQAQMV
jgi:hypothetical protein